MDDLVVEGGYLDRDLSGTWIGTYKVTLSRLSAVASTWLLASCNGRCGQRHLPEQTWATRHCGYDR
jgi:hypothetical protein